MLNIFDKIDVVGMRGKIPQMRENFAKKYYATKVSKVREAKTK